MGLIDKVSFIMILVLIFTGGFFASIVLHEMTHRRDFRDYAYNGDICILQWQEEAKWYEKIIGSYDFSYNISNTDEVDKIEKKTEFNAYIVSAIVLYITLHSFFYVLKWRAEK